jgi:protein-S-isoprenylcysteine O-methyltransferase Ste14
LIRVWSKGTLNPVVANLEVSGPYRFVRHPMYLGTVLEALGVWIACASFGWAFMFFFLGFLLLSYFLFVYKEAILIEEETLYKNFRGSWSQYAREVPAFIPKRSTLCAWKVEDLGSFHWENFEHSREWRNFIAFVGVFVFLWLKLVYRL